MERLALWSGFCALIEPYYLADEACEEALYDIAVFRDFCRIDLGHDRVPDATTLIGARRCLPGSVRCCRPTA